MYFPYLRGKQFELIAIRELSDYCSANLLRPIIEPVRRNLTPLIKTIKHLNERDITPVIIANPEVGEFSGGNTDVIDELKKYEDIRYLLCVKVEDSSDAYGISIIEGLNEPYAIQVTRGIDKKILHHTDKAELTIVDSNDTPPPALKRLNNVVLLGDFFKKKTRNSDYGNESQYSYLHGTYSENKNVIGFSDFTVMAEEFIEGGGPAYVVTIHISYINEDKFDEMYVRHYSSFDNKSPTDPGAKFINALDKLIADYDDKIINFEDTHGIQDFKKLADKRHFPGLGQVKKISIKHHIETLCKYLEANP